MSEIGDDDKRQFFEDGFLIVRNAVSSELVARAKALIQEAIPEDERHLLVPGKLATHDDITGLFNNSTLADIIERLMGPFPPVISCQVAVTPPFNLLGGKPGTHVDGGWNGVVPESAEEIDMATCRPKDAAKYFGEND